MLEYLREAAALYVNDIVQGDARSIRQEHDPPDIVRPFQSPRGCDIAAAVFFRIRLEPRHSDLRLLVDHCLQILLVRVQ